MIALAIAATLIVQTYDGRVQVNSGLSDNACQEAACVARDGMTCEESAERAAPFIAAMRRREAECQAKTHKACPTAVWTHNEAYLIATHDPQSVKLARCVK